MRSDGALMMSDKMLTDRLRKRIEQGSAYFTWQDRDLLREAAVALEERAPAEDALRIERARMAISVLHAHSTLPAAMVPKILEALEGLDEMAERLAAEPAGTNPHPEVADQYDTYMQIVSDESAPERELAEEILAELRRARAKFPGDNVTTLALVEEVGELAKATFEENRERVRKEAVQVAAMAMRVVLDGDQTLDAWRARKGLDPLTLRDLAPPHLAAHFRAVAPDSAEMDA